MKPICSLLLPLLLCVACGGETKNPVAPGPSTPAPVEGEHGPKHSLGTLRIGSHAFEVVQGGDVTAGHEAFFDLVFPAGQPLPATVRGWIGIETGVGSLKAKFGKEGDRALHGHVEVPKPIAAGSKFWVEIDDGKEAVKGSIAWK